MKPDGVVSGPLISDHDCGGDGSDAAVRVVRGRRHISAMRPLLTELAESTGQADAMDAFDLFLDAPSARGKTPYLVLIGRRERLDLRHAAPGRIDAAILIYEYKLAGRGTRLFATDDITGERVVIAQEDHRLEAAQIACRRLVRMGAIAVLISLPGKVDPLRPLIAGPERGCRIALRTRELPRYLPLAETYEATLAVLGDNTRRNFRRYRRRLVDDLGVEFVESVSMDREEFLEMNRRSSHPLPPSAAQWCLDSLSRTPHSVFCGLRAADGRWLSLLGGRRRGSILDVDWQLNLAGMDRYSLSTVMRAFLLEHEVARGTRKLHFEGGTPHAMRHSFVPENVVDIVVQRSSTEWLLRKLSSRIFPATNFLGQALRDETMQWTDWKKGLRAPRASPSQSSASPNVPDAA